MAAAFWKVFSAQEQQSALCIQHSAKDAADQRRGTQIWVKSVSGFPMEFGRSCGFAGRLSSHL